MTFVIEEKLPLETFKSFAKLLVVSREGELLSEHQSTPEAVQALTRHNAQHGEESAMIYRRIATAWIKY